MADVFLGIGGNLGSRKSNIDTAIDLISKRINKPVKISSFYLNEPWGFSHPKYFLNIVLLIKTELSPEQLLFEIKKIESEMKRVKTKDSYEGRPIDIDILFYNNEIISCDNLIIPHPKLHERLFVLVPMNEIFPDLVHPVFKESINALLQKCTDTSQIRKLNYGS